MTPGELAELVPAMERWVSDGYPDEACGLILERAGALEVLCCENLQDKMHALDPTTWPRTARTAYRIDPLVLVKAEDGGAVVRGIFHSHPDRGAYFSDEDVLSALGGDLNGDPILPGVTWVVLSVREAGVDDVKLFAWNDGTRAFEERR